MNTDKKIYHYCIDCGCKKTPNTFRNCKACMKEVKQGVYHSICKKCHSPKQTNILGVCPKCEKEIAELNMMKG